MAPGRGLAELSGEAPANMEGAELLPGGLGCTGCRGVATEKGSTGSYHRKITRYFRVKFYFTHPLKNTIITGMSEDK